MNKLRQFIDTIGAFAAKLKHPKSISLLEQAGWTTDYTAIGEEGEGGLMS